jgi:hypothetical protein
VDPLPGWYPEAQSPAPGWYPDPQQPAQMRYWDGEVWTASVAPAMGGPVHSGGPAFGSEPNGLAIASLVCSLMGLFTCGLSAVVGVVLGHIGYSQVRRSHGRQHGEGLALAGFVIGYLVILGYAALWLLVVNSSP